MRTTVRLNEHILRRAKEYAARHGTSLTRVVEDALAEKLSRSQPPHERPVLPVDGRGGLREGIPLNSNRELLALMEEDD